MKYLRKSLSFIMMGVIIIAICNFVGCRVNTEGKLKKIITTSLEEKYGEEFVCFDVWGNGGSSYWGVCAPESNQDIKFTALFLTGGKITYDGYYSSCVAEKIKDTIDIQLSDIFSRYYLHSYMMHPLKSEEANDIYVENVKNRTFDAETYIQLSIDAYNDENPSIMFYLCISTSEQSKLGFEEEYDALLNIFTAVDTLGMTSVIELKFIPEEKYTDCVEYLENSDFVYDTLSSTLEPYPINNPNTPSASFFSFTEGKGKLTLTKEEYIKQRKEVN